MKTHNFYAGPAILPQSVLQQAQEAVKEFAGMNLSLLEISHRSDEFVQVMDDALSLAKELLSVPDNYKVMFLTGGASTQFFMGPLNLLGQDQEAAYINTGTWSTKAIKEANLYGKINEIASSKDKNFSYIPKNYEVPDHLRYLHITSNNTIFGTQFDKYPEVNVPLVNDLSSDIFSQPIDVSKHMMIYAGAQKNMGPAGTTLVIVNEDELGKTGREIPSMLDYRTHIKKDSSFNTPPVFPIYVSMLTMKWVKENGGVTAMQKRNDAKATLLYNEIDRNGLFEGTAAIEDRSKMNVCFLLKDNALDDKFLEEASKANCVGLAGHRSVGGFRASIYNALDIESVQVLVDVMKDFEKTYG